MTKKPSALIIIISHMAKDPLAFSGELVSNLVGVGKPVSLCTIVLTPKTTKSASDIR